MEQNATIIDLSDILVKHSKLITENINGVNTFYVGVLTG